MNENENENVDVMGLGERFGLYDLVTAIALIIAYG